jgi:hypothetical protein
MTAVMKAMMRVEDHQAASITAHPQIPFPAETFWCKNVVRKGCGNCLSFRRVLRAHQ